MNLLFSCVMCINLFTKDYSVAPTIINHQENALCMVRRAEVWKTRQAILHGEALISGQLKSLLQMQYQLHLAYLASLLQCMEELS